MERRRLPGDSSTWGWPVVKSGSFPYGRTATVRDRGRVRKETFRLGAFSWQIRAFAEVLKDLNAALAEAGDEALEATRDDPS